MSDNYYRFFVGDYLRDTGDLSLVEHGAYHILLDHYYMQEWLPADRQKLYRMCRAFTKEEQKAIDTVVERYFTENGDGRIKNRKAEEEIAGRREFFAEQARKSKLGGEANKQRWERSRQEPKYSPQDIPRAIPKATPKDSPPSPILNTKKDIKAGYAKNDTKPPLNQTQITEDIKSRCLTINSLPKKQDPFNVYQWTKWALNKKYHPDAVLLVLDNLIQYWDSTKDPWSYASKIISIKSGNYYERDAGKDADKMKLDLVDLVNDLKAFRNTKDFSTK